jgi:hypothetical protein
MNYLATERDFINGCLTAVSTHEIDLLVFRYSDLLDSNRRLYSFARNARKRLHNLRREIKKSYNYLMN